MQAILLFSQRPVILLALLVLFLGLQPLLDLVLEVSLSLDEPVLREVHQLRLELLEEPSRSKLRVNTCGLRLQK